VNECPLVVEQQQPYQSDDAALPGYRLAPFMSLDHPLDLLEASVSSHFSGEVMLINHVRSSVEMQVY
jgi:hypothetical protein